jgi:hypothetical protein
VGATVSVAQKIRAVARTAPVEGTAEGEGFEPPRPTGRCRRLSVYRVKNPALSTRLSHPPKGGRYSAPPHDRRGVLYLATANAASTRCGLGCHNDSPWQQDFGGPPQFIHRASLKIRTPARISAVHPGGSTQSLTQPRVLEPGGVSPILACEVVPYSTSCPGLPQVPGQGGAGFVPSGPSMFTIPATSTALPSRARSCPPCPVPGCGQEPSGGGA